MESSGVGAIGRRGVDHEAHAPSGLRANRPDYFVAACGLGFSHPLDGSRAENACFAEGAACSNRAVGGCDASGVCVPVGRRKRAASPLGGVGFFKPDFGAGKRTDHSVGEREFRIRCSFIGSFARNVQRHVCAIGCDIIWRNMAQISHSAMVLFWNADEEVGLKRFRNFFAQELAYRPAVYASHHFAHQVPESSHVIARSGAGLPERFGGSQHFAQLLPVEHVFGGNRLFPSHQPRPMAQKLSDCDVFLASLGELRPIRSNRRIKL